MILKSFKKGCLLLLDGTELNWSNNFMIISFTHQAIQKVHFVLLVVHLDSMNTIASMLALNKKTTWGFVVCLVGEESDPALFTRILEACKSKVGPTTWKLGAFSHPPARIMELGNSLSSSSRPLHWACKCSNWRFS